MPPNTGTGSILDHVEYKHKQVANPYSEAKSACFEECPGTSGCGHSRDEEPQEQLMDNVVRVTTRARLTYELYKFSKNAMLIVNSTPPMARGERDEEVGELKRTFEKFGFEVKVASIGLNNRDIYEVCGQFFQRDFTDYGSVGLVVLTTMSIFYAKGVHNWVRSTIFDKLYLEESVLMENFRTDRNPTLKDKPIIYISEVGRGILGLLGDNCSGVGREAHGNVIGFHACRDEPDMAKSLYMHQQMRADEYRICEGSRPLIMFCKKLAAMGDNVNLPEIIAQTKTEYENKKPLISKILRKQVTPIETVNTLTKELYFTRMGQNL